MGRKKIEIRPLTDERNRNVTFLKRKAGLMKKAWELSVLCGADVSILIFAANGKPYEFSSKELDAEIDRYLDYEGLIERRRGAEFAAMADQDDEDSDDDGYSRRGSKVKLGTNGATAPTRSLKGQETYKTRVSSRASLARIASGSKGKSKNRDDGFIGGILSDYSTPNGVDDDQPTPSAIDTSDQRGHNDALAYAMGLHATAKSAAPATHAAHTHISQSHVRAHEPEAGPSVPPMPPMPPYSAQAQAQAQAYAMHLQATSSLTATPQPFPSLPNPSAYYGQSFPAGSFIQPYTYPPAPPALAAIPPPPQPGGVGWSREALARYAEMRLQEDHRRRHMQLLERQRQQLVELGIPVDDNSLLDQLFGPHGASGARSQPVTQHTPQPAALQAPAPSDPFIWPTLASGPGTGQSQTPGLDQSRNNSFAQEGEFIWPGGELLPSPASTHELEGKKRDRGDEILDGVSTDKRMRGV